MISTSSPASTRSSWAGRVCRAALALDRRLRALWMAHPRFHLVPHNPSFLRKITVGLSILESVIAQYDS